jgi:dimethylaniline monooxygenase (N-oxide forming)
MMKGTAETESVQRSNGCEIRPEHYQRPRKVAVIGAGAAGICSAKYLIDEGLDVTVFEIGSNLGGLWVYENDSGRSSAYRTLHINTARNLTAFSDFPFDDDVQLFPDHWDMHRYLKAYADQFGVSERVRFHSEVVAVRPLFEPGAEPARWEVELVGGERAEFDAVLCATGHLTKPLHVPEIRDPFEGQYLHSHHYRAPEDFVGKRICVVGVGNSAVDIASDVCVNSPNTVLVARSGVLIGPKLLGGIPVTDITMQLYRRWIPDAIRQRLLRLIIWLGHGRMTDYGFKPLTKRAHPTTSATVVMHIAYNRIKVKQGIDRIEGRRIHFVDGTSDEFDVLIAATGYLIDLPFIPEEVLPVVDNRVDLYKRIVVPGWPGLWFVGMVNSTTALNRIFENQIRWIKEFITGRAALPTESDMLADIQAKKDFIAQNYKESPRHTVEEEHLPYFSELRASMRAARRRADQPRSRRRLLVR